MVFPKKKTKKINHRVRNRRSSREGKRIKKKVAVKIMFWSPPAPMKNHPLRSSILLT